MSGQQVGNNGAVEATNERESGTSAVNGTSASENEQVNLVNRVVGNLSKVIKTLPLYHIIGSGADIENLEIPNTRYYLKKLLFEYLNSGGIFASYSSVLDRLFIFANKMDSEIDAEGTIWHEMTHRVLSHYPKEKIKELAERILNYDTSFQFWLMENTVNCY